MSSMISIEPFPLLQLILHTAKYSSLPVCGLLLGSLNFNSNVLGNKKKNDSMTMKNETNNDNVIDNEKEKEKEKEKENKCNDFQFKDQSDKTSSHHSQSGHISKCLPLLHSTLSLSLLIDIAIEQVRLYLQYQASQSSSTPLQVIGMYYASDSPFSKNEEVINQIFDSLNVKEGMILKFDASLLGSPPSSSSSSSSSSSLNDHSGLPFQIQPNGFSLTLTNTQSTQLKLNSTKTSTWLTELLPSCLPFSSFVLDFEDHLDKLDQDWFNNHTLQEKLAPLLD